MNLLFQDVQPKIIMDHSNSGRRTHQSRKVHWILITTISRIYEADMLHFNTASATAADASNTLKVMLLISFDPRSHHTTPFRHAIRET